MTDAQDSQVNVKLLGPNPWAALMVIGLVTIGLGVWLLLSATAGETTVTVLLAIGLVLGGLSELVWAPDRNKPIVGYLLGALFLIGAVIVILRPGTATNILALVIGIVFIVAGIMQAMGALLDRENLRHWGWICFFGLVTVAVGIMAISWPDVTIRILAIIFGIRLIVVGAGSIGFSLQLKKLS